MKNKNTLLILLFNTYLTPSTLYLCCWKCHSQSPVLRLMLWLCWKPAQRRGSVAGSVPRAQEALVLEEQIKRLSHNLAHSQAHKVSPWNVAYHHRGEDTDSHRGPWPVTRPLLHRSHRTLLHCSYPAVPRSPLSWPPDTQTTLFIHTHTLTGHLTHWRSHWLTKINSSSCYTSWNYLRISKSIACKHSIQMICTKPTAVHHMTRILISAVTEKSEQLSFKKMKTLP